MSDANCLPLELRSAAWVALLFLIPGNIARVGLITLSTLVAIGCLVNGCRPRNVNLRVEKVLREVEENIRDAIDLGLLRRSETCGPATIESKLRGIRHRAAILREITLRTSVSPWKEFKEVLKGHSFHLLMCLREVRALEVELEIAKTEEEQRRYSL